MKTISIFAIALALGGGASVALGYGPHGSAASARPSMRTIVDSASNAAFRDGLYQAKLALQRGSGVHVATGRWRSEEDRASFAAGYQQGYVQASGSKHRAGKVAVRV